MKIDLYAKRPISSGHVFLETVEVPQGTQVWYVTVREPISAFVKHSDETVPTSEYAKREFRIQHDPVNKVLEGNPRFLEV